MQYVNDIQLIDIHTNFNVYIAIKNFQATVHF